MQDEYEKGYHKGYVDRTMKVLGTINNLESEIQLIGIKPTIASVRSIFRKLRKRIQDSGVVEYPKQWER